jgi:allantoicase
MSMFENLRRQYVNLAQPRLGTEVVYATDDFFADKARLIDPAEPVFIPGKYDENGKWMDGWESRRKRSPGHDWCVIRLGEPGMISGFEIDTRHFTGNYPPGAEILVCRSDQQVPDEQAGWTTVTERLALNGDDRIYVVWGWVAKDWSTVDADARVDLLAMENGGRGIIANDEHYGCIENLTAPGRGVNMGDGWETRRRREPGHDWAVLELGTAGRVEEVVIDTAHFKGNYPDRCFLQAAPAAAGSPEEIASLSQDWPLLLPEARLEADKVRVFREELADLGAIRFVRLNIVPDGGISRLRLIGRVAR